MNIEKIMYFYKFLVSVDNILLTVYFIHSFLYASIKLHYGAQLSAKNVCQ